MITEAQVMALTDLEKAAIRLEKARKELSEASVDHTRAEQKARRLCPYIFTVPTSKDDNDD